MVVLSVACRLTLNVGIEHVKRTKPSIITLKTAWELAFSPTGDRVAYFGGRDISVLDLAGGIPLFAVHPIANPSHIDFSPDGNNLVVKGTSGRTVVLDAETGGLLSDFRNQKEGEGEGAFFSSCGRFVVSVSWAGLFSVRDWKSKELVFSQVHTDCRIHGLSVTADRHCFIYTLGYAPPSDSSPAPYTIVQQQWPTDSRGSRVLSKAWSDVYSSQISPSGRFLAVVYGTPPETLDVFDLKSSRIVASHSWSFGGIAGCSIGWSNDERVLVLNGRGDDSSSQCRVLEMPSLTVRHEFTMEYPSFFRFSPSGQYLALGSAKKAFIIPTEHLREFAESRKPNANKALQATAATPRS
jgi:WD40 repeat protein